MIGFVPSGDDRRFEVHYGHLADPAVERAPNRWPNSSSPRRNCFRASATPVYRVSHRPGRRQKRPHLVSGTRISGHPGCENLFGGTAGQPAGSPNNPNYHSATDTASMRRMPRLSHVQPRFGVDIGQRVR